MTISTKMLIWYDYKGDLAYQSIYKLKNRANDFFSMNNCEYSCLFQLVLKTFKQVFESFTSVTITGPAQDQRKFESLENNLVTIRLAK